jgi:hypothetical protein
MLTAGSLCWLKERLIREKNLGLSLSIQTLIRAIAFGVIARDMLRG